MFRISRGFGLIQALLAVALVSGAIFVFATIFNIIRLNTAGTLQTAAYKIAQEELEALRLVSNSNLTVRTDANFSNVIYNLGNAVIAADPLAASAPNILNLEPDGNLGLVLPPAGSLENFSFEAQVKAPGALQKIGLVFKAQDIDNYYFFCIQPDRIALEKISNGTESTLWEAFQTFGADTWYKLKVVVLDDTFSLYLNDTKIQDAGDSTFPSGMAALAGEGAAVEFDDASLSYGENSYSWNFDDSPPGGIPGDWRRLGLSDLPGGAGKLTISEPYGTEDIKKIDATVSWVEKGQTKSITVSTLKSQ